MTLLAVLLMLSGCQAGPVNFDKILKQALSRPVPSGTNYTKPYLKYYLPPDAGVKTATQLGSLIEIEGNQILLNIKVSKVVASQYEDFEEELTEIESNQIFYYDSGQYIDNSNEQQEYQISVFQLKENRYATILENNDVELVTLLNSSNYEFVLEHMMTIIRSVQVEEEKIYLDYSNKEIIKDRTIHEDFFEHVVPEDGSLIDMYNQLHPDDKIEE